MGVTEIEIVEGTIHDLKNVYQRCTADFASDELKSYQHLKQLMSKKNKDEILMEFYTLIEDGFLYLDRIGK